MESQSNDIYTDLLQVDIPVSVVASDLKSWTRWMRALKAKVKEARAIALQATVEQEYQVVQGESRSHYWTRLQDTEEWKFCKGRASRLDDIVCSEATLGSACYYMENKDKLSDYHGAFRLKGQDRVYLCDMCLGGDRQTQGEVMHELLALYEAREPGKGEEGRDKTPWEDIVKQPVALDPTPSTTTTRRKPSVATSVSSSDKAKPRQSKSKTPACKECGNPCVSKVSKTERNPGRLFWGCNSGCRIWNGWQT